MGKAVKVMAPYVLGLEPGARDTRAVLLDQYRTIRAWATVPVDPDRPPASLEEAVRQILAQCAAGPADLLYSVLVSDHCRQALQERRGLARVAVIRLAAPAGTAIPPLLEWPEDLRAAVGGAIFELTGGFELDGRTIGSGPDDQAVARLVSEVRRQKLEAAAITGVFSPLHPMQEIRLAAALTEALGPGFPLALSHWLGSIGLMERENGTVLNAALAHVGPRAAETTTRVLTRLGITGPVFMAQNDGTLMSLPVAARFPILTARCATGHGLRGAAHLAGLSDCAVLLCRESGIGVGLVRNGFPGETGSPRDLAGVRVSIPQPDTVSVAAEISPGMSLPHEVLERVELALDRVRGRPDPMPVVCAGPLADHLPRRLRGTTRLVRPALAPYCAAVGAALAPVGGRADLVYSLDRWTREGARADAIRQAHKRAVEAGADPATVEVSRLDEAALTYLPGNTLRVSAKVVARPLVSAGLSHADPAAPP